MVLAQNTKTGRPMIRIEDLEIHPCTYTHISSTKEKRQPVQQMLLGKVDIHMQKNETRSLSFTLYQNQFRVNQRP
jgi:Ser-tRNA(Ala) deacylase AlaX